MFLIRGFVSSYEAVRDWEAKLTPALAEDLRRRRKGKIGRSWYIDETYIRVHGCWKYLYRAIDRDGALVDVMLGEHRDLAAAKAFFRSAKAAGVTPDRVTTDGHDVPPRCGSRMQAWRAASLFWRSRSSTDPRLDSQSLTGSQKLRLLTGHNRDGSFLKREYAFPVVLYADHRPSPALCLVHQGLRERTHLGVR
jgi:hypothetical protein